MHVIIDTNSIIRILNITIFPLPSIFIAVAKSTCAGCYKHPAEEGVRHVLRPCPSS